MKKRIMGRLLLAAISATLAGRASAGILELRAGGGLSAADPKSFEDKVNAAGNGGLSADTFQTYNVDAFLNVPALPIGAGLRYEWANQTQSNASSEWKLNVNNITLLVDWRLIDTAVYVGPIVGVGYPWGTVKFKNGTENVSDQIDKKQLNYSAGLEAGVIIKRVIFGAEAGYKSVKFKGANNDTIKSDIDLSGVYGKLMVGLTFL